MKRVIGALKDLFESAALNGDDAGEAAAFALKHVKWSSALQPTEPRSPAVVDECLESLCTSAGQYGSNAHMIGEAILGAKDQIRWNLWGEGNADEPDIEAFQNRFAYCSIFGSNGPLVSDKIAGGFSIQAPDIYYPPHAHQAVETYWIIGGDGDWKIGSDPWFPVESGTLIHHETGIRHAMQTNHSALLTVWLWTTHVDSPLVMVRG
ncbi:MAG: hypothetical protein HOC63_11525 [Rhodospirillales bacterium]|jgi:hypothetical protein|nr:hypothetical protein [Rhodospirillales bacterium]MBT4040377.1 hypothetical protein [Rhodospirillales bacterium]MBT4627306.1 hypothetical protein [Rhodospirillales bacterium]MBT5351269.1 hypothetical protein [Rhodospirillales bacterium]MBT5520106.1 hypothetical protein [Rhodospirillales bacterium]